MNWLDFCLYDESTGLHIRVVSIRSWISLVWFDGFNSSATLVLLFDDVGKRVR